MAGHPEGGAGSTLQGHLVAVRQVITVEDSPGTLIKTEVMYPRKRPRSRSANMMMAEAGINREGERKQKRNRGRAPMPAGHR